jgi:putative glutamine amidotransferase
MSLSSLPRPRIGIPYRLKKEEVTGDGNISPYLRAVEMAGAIAVPVSLRLDSSELEALAATLDGVVLSGSPADVDPLRFRAERNRETADADPDRERTDFALIEHALTAQKPLLAICYGIQSLNVFLGGTLIQDIPSEVGAQIEHDWDDTRSDPEAFHEARIAEESQIGRLAAAAQATVNSSHHQSVRDVGRDLRAIAWASDGVIEAVEWAGEGQWILGVQWHPERMADTDPLAKKLFAELIETANARKSVARG